MPWWKSVAREPLVHFVAIGAVLFAIDRWREPDVAPSPAPDPAPASTPAAPAVPATGPRSIVIDDAVRAQIASAAERRLGHAPTQAELADETERWIDEEILYREALARGLDRDDPVIHQRIAERMAYVLDEATPVAEPTEAELRAWFDAHRDRWAVPEHIDFTHVFVAGTDAAAEARADQIAAALAAGAAPERLGDRFSGGHRYRGRRIADLALAFGDEFVAGLATQPPGTWVKRRSRHGLHLVRVDRVDAARDADFARARLDVRKEWLDAHRGDAAREAMRELRAGWTIEQR
ncbi:MAG TPA: peptidylprolyl isomerase [Kofleriaceae bacterium]|nr:peptidylprolyl isomerase [Kofleriaceae bacterium]